MDWKRPRLRKIIRVTLFRILEHPAALEIIHSRLCMPVVNYTSCLEWLMMGDSVEVELVRSALETLYRKLEGVKAIKLATASV